MAAHLAAAMWFQGADFASSDAIKVLTWAVCIIAFCSFVQFLVFLGAAIAGLRAYKSATKALAEVKGKAYPLIGSVQGVVEDVRPKVVAITESVRGIMDDARPKVAQVTENVRSIVEDSTPKIKAMTSDVRTISANVVETSETLKEKAREIADNVSQTVDDANRKTRAQVGKVDHMVTSAFQATGEVAAKIHHGIKVPVNEVVGWVNGAKASLDKFLSHKKAAKAKDTTISSYAGGSSASETQDRAGFPESGRYSASQEFAGRPGASLSERYQAAAAQAADHDVLSDPSSAVVPSPGAQEVVDRFRAAMKEGDPPKSVV